MNDLLREFLLEADELLELLFADIEQLAGRYHEGRARRELVGRIFRHVHTIKGTAGAAELTVTSQVAHSFESLLEAVRMGRTGVNDDLIDLFNDTAVAIANALQAASRGEATQAPVALLSRLHQATSSTTAPPTREAPRSTEEQILRALPPDIAPALSQHEQQRLREILLEGTPLFLVAVDFDLATFDNSFRSLSSTLNEKGELISTLPGLGASSPDKINFRIIHATTDSAEELARRVSGFEAITLTPLTVEKEEQPVADTPTHEFDSNVEPTGDDFPSSNSPLNSVVRVELRELDELITEAHELMTVTETVFGTTLSRHIAGRERTELEIRVSRIRRAFIELEERLIGLRMISLSHTLARAARVGSIAARTLGLNVGIEIEGSDVRLDKSVADAVSDPLLHLLRNAVSHGIESAEERLALGKSENGTVRIEAVSEGSRVRLRVTDDGRGIDPERVARVAVERGLIEDGTGLTKHESLRLIFRPGFSTADLVSDVSGRGVGLDVVERAIEQVGGELRVSSELGTGTTFEMVLPTTLALAPSLVVSSAGYKYTIDASHISEAGYASLDDIERSSAGEATVWRGIRMPVLRLRKLLGQEEESGVAPERYHVVISHIAGQAEAEQDSESESSEQRGSAAVVVDGWDGHSDVLVRSLGRHAALWRGVSGAAELRDGNTALVLDLPRLLEMNTSSVGMD